LAGKGPIVAVDLDGQSSFSKRMVTRMSTRPGGTFGMMPKLQHLTDLPKQHAKARMQSVEWFIIDTPASSHTESDAAIQLADLVIIPVKASILDAEATEPTWQMCRKYGKRFLFVLNEVSAPREALETMSVLSQVGPVCPVIVPRAVNFSKCMTDGLTLPELGVKRDTASIQAINRFIDHITITATVA
jgi:chromosome partitioning protein